MIEPVRIYDEETGRAIPPGTKDPSEVIFQRAINRAINMLISEHNDLVKAVGLYIDREIARPALGIETGPEAVQKARELLTGLFERRRDPNHPHPNPPEAAYRGTIPHA